MVMRAGASVYGGEEAYAGPPNARRPSTGSTRKRIEVLPGVRRPRRFEPRAGTGHEHYLGVTTSWLVRKCSVDGAGRSSSMTEDVRILALPLADRLRIA